MNKKWEYCDINTKDVEEIRNITKEAVNFPGEQLVRNNKIHNNNTNNNHTIIIEDAHFELGNLTTEQCKQVIYKGLHESYDRVV